MSSLVAKYFSEGFPLRKNGASLTLWDDDVKIKSFTVTLLTCIAALENQVKDAPLRPNPLAPTATTKALAVSSHICQGFRLIVDFLKLQLMMTLSELSIWHFFVHLLSVAVW